MKPNLRILSSATVLLVCVAALPMAAATDLRETIDKVWSMLPPGLQICSPGAVYWGQPVDLGRTVTYHVPVPATDSGFVFSPSTGTNAYLDHAYGTVYAVFGQLGDLCTIKP